MLRRIRQFSYLAWWQLRAFAGRRAPLQSVIFILDRCNLRCRHCSVYAIATPRIKTLAQIREELEYCYRQGSRFVDFEGGELYLWKDETEPGRTYRINDVVDLAHQIGFWSVTITTNAQLPFEGTHADQVWVSMDGVGEWHDGIRGKGTFERLDQNIRRYGQWRQSQGRTAAPVCVNMVLNNENYPSLEQALEYVRQSPFIDQISVNFHTPFSETEGLFLDPDIRNRIIDRLIDYKRRGYPIMNSRSGLRAMKMHQGRTRCTDRHCWVTNFIFSDGSRSPKCMGYVHGVCDRCGFSMGGEMYAMQHLCPDTLLSGLKLRT
jgi:MoaA/NifB/PqqE/SkfB family radical SAM enzyme